jgi:hypothetical protein
VAALAPVPPAPVRAGAPAGGATCRAPRDWSVGVETRTRVPAVRPCAAPRSSVSPAATAPRTSTRSEASSRRPISTGTGSARPARTRTTCGRTPRWSTASAGTTSASRVSLATRPWANSPPTSRFPAFGTAAITCTCRVVGSATGAMRMMRPVKSRPGYPVTLNVTGAPTRTCPSWSAGTLPVSCMLDGSTTV